MVDNGRCDNGFPWSLGACEYECDKSLFTKYTKLCVPDVVKSVSVKVFNLLPKTSETSYVSWHETCARKCRLEASVCNDRQRWNNNKCKCECK